MSIDYDIIYENGKVDKLRETACFSQFTSFGDYYFPEGLFDEFSKKYREERNGKGRRREELAKLGYILKEVRYFPKIYLYDRIKERHIIKKWISFILYDLFPGIKKKGCSTRSIMNGNGLIINMKNYSVLIMQVLSCIRYIDEDYETIKTWYDLVEKGMNKRVAFILSHIYSKNNSIGHSSLTTISYLTWDELSSFIKKETTRKNMKRIKGVGRMKDSFSIKTSMYFHFREIKYSYYNRDDEILFKEKLSRKINYDINSDKKDIKKINSLILKEIRK